jgi:hypothetical protein
MGWLALALDSLLAAAGRGFQGRKNGDRDGELRQEPLVPRSRRPAAVRDRIPSSQSRRPWFLACHCTCCVTRGV